VERTSIVSLRANTAERAALLALARRERRTVSEFLRETIREQARAAGLWPPAEMLGGEAAREEVSRDR